MDRPDLETLAKTWLAHDPDGETCAELEESLAKVAAGDEAALTDLRDAFGAALEFGTAGLRGVLGAGPNRMNRAVVRRTTHGLAKALLASSPQAKERGVVIGYDGRRNSLLFAEDTACVLAAAGIRVHLFEDVAPTPLTAFALLRLNAAAAVMVTASHNPPEYNGFKVYWENGAQIIPPVDGIIASAIEEAPPADEVPLLPLDDAREQGLVQPVPPSVEGDYLAGIEALGATDDQGDPVGRRTIKIVYTAMHGVGNRLALKALAQGGFGEVHTVAEQAQPDGRFPTVAFPNPEEKGAMDLSFALATRVGADVIFANDPDADRLAIAIPSREKDGRFTQLTGNEVGVLLGHYLLTTRTATQPAVFNSVVSSPLLGTIAKAKGAAFAETLTGFKWIANTAMRFEKERGTTTLFGYEEALGYSVGNLVRDKDGISALAIAAELVAVLAEKKETLWDRLDGIAREFGLYVSGQRTIVRKGPDGQKELAALMERLRSQDPSTIGGYAVVRRVDFQTGSIQRADGVAETIDFPPSNVLVYELAGGSRVIARPSGTEPKAKFYVDVRVDMGAQESLDDARTRAQQALEALADAIVALVDG